MTAQGWYADPFGGHADRWFSAGHPTSLVRDDGIESTRPPAESSWIGPLVRAEEADSSDDRRAGDSVGSGVAPGPADALHAFVKLGMFER